jgi:hypothetical protein
MGRRVGATVVLGLALAVAGCGGHSASAPKPTNAIERAALKTSQAGSMHADFTISGTGVQGSGSGVFNGGGNRSGQLSMNITASGQQLSIDSVIDGNTIYLRSPAITRQLPGGKQWVKLDLDKAAKQNNSSLNGLLNANPSPSGPLSYLLGSTVVKKVGSDKVRGVATSRYQVTVDLNRAADNISGAERDALKQAIKAGGSSTQLLDVWTDDQGYVRKVQYQAPGASKSTLTMELHDFGSPVSISDPPTNQVVDILQSLGLGG